MKRITLLFALVCLYHIAVFGQKKYEMVIEKTDGSTIVIKTEDIVRTYFREITSGNTSHTTCPDGNHPHMLDLGLPSGTKWSCCNIGANTPEESGGYYAWGETDEKSMYTWSTYLYGTKENPVNIGADIQGTQYDVAVAKWGNTWCLPTSEQCQELINNTNSTWTTVNGVNGWLFKGGNGGSLFLPAVGIKWDDRIHENNKSGNYMTSSLIISDPKNIWTIYFDKDDYIGLDPGLRPDGFSVRPISK